MEWNVCRIICTLGFLLCIKVLQLVLDMVVLDFYVCVTVHRNKFLYNKTNQLHKISQIYFGMKLYMFCAVPLPVIRSLFTVHTAMVYVNTGLKTAFQQFHHGPAGKLSSNLYDV